MKRPGALALISIGSGLILLAASPARTDDDVRPRRLVLSDGWKIQFSVLVAEQGPALSEPGHPVKGWLATKVPTTVLGSLVARGVYPDPRIGLNSLQIPDASDAFNRKHDRARFSHLPDHRNPWLDPWWYRADFDLPAPGAGRRVWLELGSINYRADVWLNGTKVADRR
jgi:exo-1,4-beta-D-glucosaminidase